MQQLYTDAVDSCMATTIEVAKSPDGMYEAKSASFSAKGVTSEDAIEQLSVKIQVAVKQGDYYPGMT